MAIINLYCGEQNIKLLDSPLITAGDENEDSLQITFSSSWEGYTKIAVFYRDADNLLYSKIEENNTCKVPNSLLIDEGVICIGIVGFKSTDGEYQTRTTEVMRYNIAEGAYSARTSEIIRYNVTEGALAGLSIEDPTLSELFFHQIERAEINTEGHLIITLHDESKLDAGAVCDPTSYDKLEAEIKAEAESRATGDADTLTSAKAYTDEQIATIDLSPYAKTETVETELAKKQNNLTAGQNVTLDNDTVSVDLSAYEKAADVDTKLAKKQDALTAGNNVSITGNTVSVDLSAYAKSADLGIYATQTYVQDEIQAAVYDVMGASY